MEVAELLEEEHRSDCDQREWERDAVPASCWHLSGSFVGVPALRSGAGLHGGEGRALDSEIEK